MNDLLGGHVPVAFGVLPPAMGNLAAGTLRGIAMLDKQRFSLLPNIPTAHESGLPGFESVLHYGLLGPAGMPRPIVDKLNAAMRKRRQHRRGEEAHQHRGRRSADLDAGGIRRRHRPGGAQVGGADQEAQPEGGVMRTRLDHCRGAARRGPSFAAPASAQDYPTRPITLVVPFPAGGGNDALARIVAEKMSRTLGQQVVVENRARRRRHRRHPRGREGRAGRLHDPAHLHRHARDQSDALSQRRLRSAQGFRADRVDRLAAERADGASVAAGPFDRGA